MANKSLWFPDFLNKLLSFAMTCLKFKKYFDNLWSSADKCNYYCIQTFLTLGEIDVKHYESSPPKIILRLSHEISTFFRNFTEIWRLFADLALLWKYLQNFLRYSLKYQQNGQNTYGFSADFLANFLQIFYRFFLIWEFNQSFHKFVSTDFICIEQIKNKSWYKV